MNSRISRPAATKFAVGAGLVSSATAVVVMHGASTPTGVKLPDAVNANSAAMLSQRSASADQATSRSAGRADAGAAIVAPVAPRSAPAGPPKVTAVPKSTPAPKATASKDLRDSVESRGASGSKASQGESSSGDDTGSASDTAYLSQGRAKGLGDNAARVYSAVRSKFGITNIGGYRSGDSGDHGSGRAVDVMVSGSRGDAVADWAIANMSRYNITYIIFNQRIYMKGKGWKMMEDRGSATQNHYDHVHISVG